MRSASHFITGRVPGGQRPIDRLDMAAAGLLYAFVFWIPWEGIVTVPGIGAANRVLGFAALCFFLLAARAGCIRRLHTCHVMLLLFVLSETASFLWTIDPAEAAIRIPSLWQLLVLSWLIWQTAKTETRVGCLADAYIYGSAVAALATIWQYLEGNTYLGIQERRFVAPGSDPNSLAIALAFAVPLAWLRSSQATSRTKALLLAGISVLSIAALIPTGSRTGIVSLLGCVLILPALWKSHSLGPRFAVALLAGLLITLFGSGLSDYPLKRLGTTGDELRHGDWDNRISIWKAGIGVFAEHPWLGVGAGGCVKAVAPILHFRGDPHGGRPVAHNTFLSVIIETGLAGALPFLFAVASVVASLSRIPRTERKFWAAAFVIWFIGASSLTWEHNKLTWLAFSFILARSRITTWRWKAVYPLSQPALEVAAS